MLRQPTALSQSQYTHTQYICMRFVPEFKHTKQRPPLCIKSKSNPLVPSLCIKSKYPSYIYVMYHHVYMSPRHLELSTMVAPSHAPHVPALYTTVHIFLPVSLSRPPPLPPSAKSQLLLSSNITYVLAARTKKAKKTYSTPFY